MGEVSRQADGIHRQAIHPTDHKGRRPELASGELERCQPSTVRTRLRLLNALFGVVVEEGWVQSNHFFELTKRVRGCADKNEVVLLDEADKVWRKLPEHHQLLWHIFRWTGSHASEAAGLMWVDIDLS